MNLNLQSKRVIVTGGNRGIGRCCALALAREKARVCITARDHKHLDNTLKEIQNLSGDGYAVSADLTREDDCLKVVNETVEAFGGIDILINCAGAAGNRDIVAGELSSANIVEAQKRAKRCMASGFKDCD